MVETGPAHRPLVVASPGGPLRFLCPHGLITRFGVFQYGMIYSLPPLMIFAGCGLFLMLDKSTDSEV